MVRAYVAEHETRSGVRAYAGVREGQVERTLKVDHDARRICHCSAPHPHDFSPCGELADHVRFVADDEPQNGDDVPASGPRRTVTSSGPSPSCVSRLSFRHDEEAVRGSIEVRIAPLLAESFSRSGWAVVVHVARVVRSEKAVVVNELLTGNATPLTPLLVIYQVLFDRLGIPFVLVLACKYDVLVHS